MKMRKTMIMAILFTVGALGAFATLSANAAIAVSAVSASSELTADHGAGKASDGIIDTTNDNMWHSAQGDSSPWIVIFLGGTYTVNKVVLHVHTARTVNSANSISIYGSTTNVKDDSFKLIKEVNGTAGPIETITFDDTKVKYLKIKSKGDGEFFALREVQVFPDLKPNVTGSGKQ